MRKYEKNIEDRKVLVTRISELTGLDARYTRVPRCAYEVGAFTVEKDGRLSVEEGADESIIEMLISEELIGACIEETYSESTALTQNPAPSLQPDPGSEERSEEDSEGIPNPSENEQRPIEELRTSMGEGDAEETPAFPMNARISFPLCRHTVESLTNLICMLHTRGPLISKATGGAFYVDKNLVSDILNEDSFDSPEELIAFVKEWDDSENAIQGLDFDEETVTFNGFTGVQDADHLRTFTRLAAAMNKMAQMQKRVQAKETDDTNEKYSLRVWLVRLGMNGPDYKADRKILMKNLSGHIAFRTKADEDKWKAKQKMKKEAMKAAQTKAEE